MTSSRFLRPSIGIFLLAFGIGVAAVAKADAADSASPRPNILLVLSDDQSVPFLGVYGYPIKTPRLDQFAAEAMRFDRFFTNAPQCVPSRAALMTGRAPSAARMGRFSSPLPSDIPTLPGVLHAAGYFTGVCGRTYHLDGSGGPWRAKDATDLVIEKHDLARFRDNFDFVDVSEGLDNTPQLFEKFLADVPAGEPFFFWINFQDPHYPWNKPNAFAGSNPPDTLEVPGYLPDIPSVRDALAAHFDEVTRLDDQFGRIRKVLESRGLADNTIVIFLGDNGFAFPHGKGSLHDPGVQVPCLIKWPGVTAPGSVTDAIVAGEDLMPTLLDASGTPIPDTLRSISFAPVLRGDRNGDGDGARRYFFGERGTQGIAPATSMRSIKTTTAYDLARSVRSDRWKLICNYTPYSLYAPVDSQKLPYWHEMQRLNDEGQLAAKFSRAYFTWPRPTWELYDLEADPDEMDNLYGREGTEEITNELKTALLENMVLNYDFLPLPDVAEPTEPAQSAAQPTDAPDAH